MGKIDRVIRARSKRKVRLGNFDIYNVIRRVKALYWRAVMATPSKQIESRAV